MRAHLAKPWSGFEAQQPHGMHDAAVHRLQPVAHIGQRAVHDRRQRIGEIALLERLLQVDRFDVIAAVGRRRQQALSHGSGLSEPLIRGKPRGKAAGNRHRRNRDAGEHAGMRRFRLPFAAFFGPCARSRLFPSSSLMMDIGERANDLQDQLSGNDTMTSSFTLRRLALSTHAVLPRRFDAALAQDAAAVADRLKAVLAAQGVDDQLDQGDRRRLADGA